jgi:hypothetical protein
MCILLLSAFSQRAHSKEIYEYVIYFLLNNFTWAFYLREHGFKFVIRKVIMKLSFQNEGLLKSDMCPN